MKSSGRKLLLITLMVIGLLLCAPGQADSQPHTPEPDAQEEPVAPEHGAAEPEDPNDAPREVEPTPEPTPTPVPEPEPTMLVERIKVSSPAAGMCLFPGQRVQAHARVYPEGADHRALDWSSSDPDLASVDGSGMVRVPRTAHLPDEGKYVDIWAKATDGSFVMNCATIRVMPSATKVQFLDEELVVLADATERTTSVPVEIAPASCYGYVEIEWISSNPEIVSVAPGGTAGEIGQLTWRDLPGRAVITAQAADGLRKSDRLTVVVKNASHSIELMEPDAIERGVPIPLGAVARDARGTALDVPICWAMVSDAPGATVSESGNLLLDWRCRSPQIIVSATAQDEGMATGYLSISLLADPGRE